MFRTVSVVTPGLRRRNGRLAPCPRPTGSTHTGTSGNDSEASRTRGPCSFSGRGPRVSVQAGGGGGAVACPDMAACCPKGCDRGKPPARSGSYILCVACDAAPDVRADVAKADGCQREVASADRASCRASTAGWRAPEEEGTSSQALVMLDAVASPSGGLRRASSSLSHLASNLMSSALATAAVPFLTSASMLRPAMLLCTISCN
mmetsp:Transcript_142862/g.397982  ORF Transcript_142862/g.397982 Transcript_142862/m.397982 type:complete len:205 (+) Transcript_142862:598-1212(+)